MSKAKVPVLDPIRDMRSVENLSVTRAPGILARVGTDCIRLVRDALSPLTTLIGFAGSPWTVATYMIEGQGGTDHEHSRRMAWAEPHLFEKLLDKLVQATTLYLISQIDAGAEVLQLFDSWAGSVPAGFIFDVAVIEPTTKIVKAIGKIAPAYQLSDFRALPQRIWIAMPP